jgi:hypothetical protein
MKEHPRRAARDPLKGAALAVRQSRPGGASGFTPLTPEMSHPRRAARDPLKGAALAVRQSRPGGASGFGHFAPAGPCPCR